jgi:type VI secretion system protein ImpH
MQLTLAFPASAIHDIEPSSDPSDPVRVTVAFMGLTGTQGVLPLHYTERMIARRAAHDDTFRDFLDIFNHRFISHFYRAWEKHHPTVLYEMAVIRARGTDAFTQSLFDFIGIGSHGLRGRMRVHDEGLLFYAGLIAQRPHSASALRGILRDYFSIPVEIAQFVGGWYPLEHADRSYLSGEQERNQLAVGAFIGSKVWDPQARFRIRLGPVGLKRFESLLPGSMALAEVMELARFFVGQAVVFDIQVALRAAETPYCRLSDRGPHAPRLGWMAWLKTRPFKADAEDAVFRCVN